MTRVSRMFAVTAILTGTVVMHSTPVSASFLRVGEFDGGSIVWDGDSEVRTMNLNGTNLTTIIFGDPSELYVQATLINDLDGLIGVHPLRLILSSADATENAAWLTLAEVQAISPALKTYDVTASADLDRRVVAFYADLTSLGSLQYGLTADQQTALDLLLASFPTQSFKIGLGVRLGTSLTAGCDPFDFDCERAQARFDVLARDAPEPATLTLIAAGLAGIAIRRRRK
jgi:PEP-CTERM motif-containing protein